MWAPRQAGVEFTSRRVNAAPYRQTLDQHKQRKDRTVRAGQGQGATQLWRQGLKYSVS